MDQQSPLVISTFSADELVSHFRELGALLHACVQAGASIGFVLPFAAEESEAFWREKVLPEVRAGTRALLVARLGGRIAGAVQLGTGTLPNQRHRADAAEPLYASLGYKTAGVIPGYCRDAREDRLDPTTVMYKAL